MTIERLQKILKELVEHDGDIKAQVMAFDPDSGVTNEVTGYVYDPVAKTLALETR